VDWGRYILIVNKLKTAVGLLWVRKINTILFWYENKSPLKLAKTMKKFVKIIAKSLQNHCSL